MKGKEIREVNGILLLNKPLGITSNKILQKVKRIYRAKKAGHTGTLDPLATGMLPICFGKSTKLTNQFLNSNKCYQVTMELGYETDSFDLEGTVVKRAEVLESHIKKIPEILEKFRGPQQQIPPMFSAIRHNGKRLHQLARAGIEVEREPRDINIFRLELIDNPSLLCSEPSLAAPDCALPQSEPSFPRRRESSFQLEVLCSKGTYIRTLVADIGRELGCYATVTQLHRVYVEPFDKDKIIDFDFIASSSDLESEDLSSLDQLLLNL